MNEFISKNISYFSKVIAVLFLASTFACGFDKDASKPPETKLEREIPELTQEIHEILKRAKENSEKLDETSGRTPRFEPQTTQEVFQKDPPLFRTRDQILELMVRNGSLKKSEAIELDRQLSIISKYASSATSYIKPSDFKNLHEESVLRELIEISRNVKKVRGFFPRETQLIAVLSLLKGENRLLQAATGQGKSLIVGMTAIAQQKLRLPFVFGDDRPMAVHVFAPTDNLARASFKENEALFKACNVRARHISTDGSSSDIIYGTPFDFEGAALNELSNRHEPKMVLNAAVRRTVILDESDSHLIDGATGRVIYSEKDPDNVLVRASLQLIGESVQKYYRTHSQKPDEETTSLFLEAIKNALLQAHPEFEKRFSASGHKWLQSAFEILDPSVNNKWQDGIRFVVQPSLASELANFQARVRLSAANSLELKKITEAIEDLAAKKKSGEMTKSLERNSISKIANQLSHLLRRIDKKRLPQSLRSQCEKLMKAAKELTLPNLLLGRITYLNVETGQIIDRMIFSDGVQAFLELKYLKEIVHEPTISFRSYSLFKYVSSADLTLGLSGTVGVNNDELMNFQRHVWKIKRAVELPEFAVSRLKCVADPIKASNAQEWLVAIEKAISERTRTQPVLIITENPRRAWEASDHLRQRRLEPLLYAEMTDEHLLEEKLAPKQIIISTNLGGRGSDYKVDSATAPDGLHVILAFDSDESRILLQARGRGGRAGERGTFQEISFGPALKQKPDMSYIKNGLKNTMVGDMMMENYVQFLGVVNDAELRHKISSGQYEIFKSLVGNWVSSPHVSKKLKSRIVQPGIGAAELTDIVLESISDYMRECRNPAAMTFIEILNSDGNSEKLRSDIGSSLERFLHELNRISMTV